MRYFFIEPDAIYGEKALIIEPDAGHIRKVLRLKPGDPVGLLDGSGLEYHARIRDFSNQGITAIIEDRFHCTSESPVSITLAQGFLKETKMDDLVRQLTELGIHQWMPFMARRSVPRPNDKQLEKRMERWRTISKQAIKQCRRGRYMHILSPLSFTQVLAAGKNYDGKILFWESETSPLKEIHAGFTGKKVTSVFVVVGPEGGFTEEEVALAKESGFHIAGLGPRILRAETATLAAATLVQHLFGDLG